MSRSFDLNITFDLKNFYNNLMEYIDVIKSIMIEHNLTQQKLANILGVNQTTVGQWLLGRKKPGYDSIWSIYEHFSVTPNQLFGIDY